MLSDRSEGVVEPLRSPTRELRVAVRSLRIRLVMPKDEAWMSWSSSDVMVCIDVPLDSLESASVIFGAAIAILESSDGTTGL